MVRLSAVADGASMTDKTEGRTFPKGSALAAGQATAGYLGTTTAVSYTHLDVYKRQS